MALFWFELGRWCPDIPSTGICFDCKSNKSVWQSDKVHYLVSDRTSSNARPGLFTSGL
jgi:hypothetical protein